MVKKVSVILNIFLLAVVFVLASRIASQPKNDVCRVEKPLPQCVSRTDTAEARGDSMKPQIVSGQKVELLYGYYDCQPVRRDDVVAYNYAGDKVPIIKSVKALPGDKWSAEKDGTGNFYRIIVNGVKLTNFEGKDYQIPENKAKMIKLYASSYPVVPEGSYLIFGNVVSGSADSTQFGLVGKKDIIAKVKY